MTKYFTFFLYLFLTPLWHLSQNNNAVYGDEFIAGTLPGEDRLFASDSSGIYFFSDVTENPEGFPIFFLQKFSLPGGKKVFSKAFTLPAKTSCRILSSVLIRSKIIVHVSILYPDRKQILQKYICHASNGSNADPPMVVESSDAEFQGDNEFRFLVQYSPDLSKMAIVKEVMVNTNREPRQVKMYSTVTEKILWKQELNQGSEFTVPPIGTEIQDGFNSVVDNAGRFCYLYYTNNEETGVQIIKDNYSDNKSLIISNPSITIVNSNLDVLNGELYCSGEVTEGHRKYKMYQDEGAKMGFFMMKIDAGNGSLIRQNNSYFNEDLISKLNYQDKNPHYSFEGVKSFYYSNKTYKHFKAIYHQGDIYLIKYHGFDWEKTEPVYRHFFANKEIIVFKYRDMDLKWMQILPRHTFTQSKGGKGDMTNIGLLPGKQIHLYYFDKASNISKYPDPGNYRNKKYGKVKNPTSVVSHISISAEGKISRDIPVKGKNLYLIENESISETDPLKYCVFSSRDKKIRRILLLKAE